MFSEKIKHACFQLNTHEKKIVKPEFQANPISLLPPSPQYTHTHTRAHALTHARTHTHAENLIDERGSTILIPCYTKPSLKTGL